MSAPINPGSALGLSIETTAAMLDRVLLSNASPTTPRRQRNRKGTSPDSKTKSPNAFMLYRSFVYNNHLLPVECVAHQSNVSKSAAKAWKYEKKEVRDTFFQLAHLRKKEKIIADGTYGMPTPKVSKSRTSQNRKKAKKSQPAHLDDAFTMQTPQFSPMGPTASSSPYCASLPPTTPQYDLGVLPFLQEEAVAATGGLPIMLDSNISYAWDASPQASDLGIGSYMGYNAPAFQPEIPLSPLLMGDSSFLGNSSFFGNYAGGQYNEAVFGQDTSPLTSFDMNDMEMGLLAEIMGAFDQFPISGGGWA